MVTLGRNIGLETNAALPELQDGGAFMNTWPRSGQASEPQFPSLSMRNPGYWLLRRAGKDDFLVAGRAPISVLSLGGTIASVNTANGKTPKLGIEGIMERIGDRTPWPELYIPTPGSRKYYAGSPKESSDISMRDIMIVVDRLFHHLQVSNSVVVTCGTDCLADIAKMVFLMLQRPLHPIIFTGAQKTLDDPENDVERNLRDAFFMADKLDPGVYVVFGGRVLNAFDAYKFSTIDLDAFRSSLHRGELGTVDSTNGSYQIHDDRYMLGKELRNLLKSLGSSNDDQTTFCDYAHDPKVCTVEINTAHDTMAAEILLKNEHIRGLVVKIPGAGGITEEAAQRLSRAAEYTNTKGAKHCKPVVIATRCPDGGTDLELYASSAGVNNCPAIISSGNISASAAVQLLQWGLGGTASVDKLRELFANPAQPITMPCIDRSLLLDGAGVCCEPWDRNPFKAMMVSYGYAAETDSSLRTND